MRKVIVTLLCSTSIAFAGVGDDFGYSEKGRLQSLPLPAKSGGTRPPDLPAAVGVAKPHPVSAENPSDPNEPGRSGTRGDTRACAMATNACKMMCMDASSYQDCMVQCSSGNSSCK